MKKRVLVNIQDSKLFIRVNEKERTLPPIVYTHTHIHKMTTCSMVDAFAMFVADPCRCVQPSFSFIASLLPILMLVVSEILPFTHTIQANGLLHAIFDYAKRFDRFKNSNSASPSAASDPLEKPTES